MIELMKGEFVGQRSDEQVVLVFRRHPIVITKGFLALLLVSAVTFMPMIIVPSNQNLLYVGLGGVVLGLLIFFYHWIGWYFSFYIVTNQRIRQNTQRGLFSKSVVDLGLNKVQSAFVNVHGVLGNILKYGTIKLHTQVGDMVIKKVANAEMVYGIIQEEMGKIEHEDEQEETDE